MVPDQQGKRTCEHQIGVLARLRDKCEAGCEDRGYRRIPCLTEVKRLAPNTTKAMVAAIKAMKPVWGGKAPSFAVAICSGIAIAATMSPARISGSKSVAPNPANERNICTLGRAFAEMVCVLTAIRRQLATARAIRQSVPIRRSAFALGPGYCRQLEFDLGLTVHT